MKLKASGGIKTFEQAAEFVNAGCERLGPALLPLLQKKLGKIFLG